MTTIPRSTDSELGEGVIQNQLANGELPTQVKELKKFVCQVYCKVGSTYHPSWTSMGALSIQELRGRDAASNACFLTPSHHARENSWPCATNSIPPAAQIFLPSKRMAGVNAKEHTFPLCAFLSLHPKLLWSLPNAAASQTARDAVAVLRTEFHAHLFVNALEKSV